MEERGSRRRRIYDKFGFKKEKLITPEPKASDASSEFSFHESSEIITSRPVGASPSAIEVASPLVERPVPRLEVNPSSPPSGASQPEPGISDPLPGSGQLGPLQTPSTTTRSPSISDAEGRSSSESTDLKSKSSTSTIGRLSSKLSSKRSKRSNASATPILPPEETIGLFELTDPSDADIDIIAVHGLQGHRSKTWSEDSSEHSTLWLRDFLSIDLPKARIMTFGYDAKIVGGSSVTTIRTTAEKLLDRVIAKRNGSRGNCLDRPIMFIAHSLGGIVFKQALVLARQKFLNEAYVDIFENVKAVAFLGVPHQGSDVAQLGKSLFDLVEAMAIVKVNTNLVSDLQRNSKALFMISQESGHSLAALTEILSFYEEEKYKKVQVVPKDSAATGQTKERLIGVPAHHRSIARITEHKSTKYDIIGINIVNLAKQIIASSHDSQTKSPKEERGNETQDKHPLLEKVMGKLHFQGMHRRHDNISNAWAIQEGQWLFENSEYLNWRDQSNPFLILSGKPGSGKSVLMYSLIKRHEKDNHSLRFYFDANHTSDCGLHIRETGFFRSIVYQLMKIRAPPNDIVEKFEGSSSGEDGCVDIDALKAACRTILSQKDDNKPRVYLFIDALDECHPTHSLSILGYLDEIVTQASAAGTDLKICISSRPHPPIRPFRRNGSPHLIVIDRNNEAELKALVRDGLKAPDISHEDHLELVNYIFQRADGVFLWVDLLLKQDLHARKSKESIKEMIEQMPTDLSKVYQKSFAERSELEKKQACQLFQIVLFARQPLSWQEVRHAYAFREEWKNVKTIDQWEQSKSSLPKQKENFEEMMLDLSGGLLNIHQEGSAETERSTVQLIHLTLREHLLKTGLRDLDSTVSDNLDLDDPGCNLNLFRITSRSLEADSLLSSTKFPTPFRRYACSWWPTHARLSDLQLSQKISAVTVPAILLSCQKNPAKLARLMSAYKADLSSRDWRRDRERKGLESLFVTLAAEGCAAILDQHAQSCECLRDPEYSPLPINQALYVAARFGLLETVQRLKAYQPDVNFKHRVNHDKTPLYIASFSGYLDVVEELIEMGARVTRKPLNDCKHEDVLEVLRQQMQKQRKAARVVAEEEKSKADGPELLEQPAPGA